jgi:hypothetical protein
MMARSKCSNQRPDTLMQDRSLPARRNHLQRTAGPYIWVNNGPDGPETPLPLYPNERTSRDPPGRSGSCHNQSASVSRVSGASVLSVNKFRVVGAAAHPGFSGLKGRLGHRVTAGSTTPLSAWQKQGCTGGVQCVCRCRASPRNGRRQCRRKACQASPDLRYRSAHLSDRVH